MKLDLKDVLKHSFVITIDEKRFNDFKAIFKCQKLSPLPKRFEGTTDWWNSPQYNCYLSHKKAILEAKRRKWPYVCIFEDDAYPCVDVRREMEKVLENVPDECGALALGYIAILGMSGLDNGFMTGFRGYGSHAYIVFKDAYDKYIETLDNHPEGDGVFYSAPKDNLLGTERMFGSAKNLFIQFSKGNTMNNSGGYVYLEKLIPLGNGKAIIPRDKSISEGKVVEMGFPKASEIFPNYVHVDKEPQLVAMRVGSLRQGLLDFISSLELDNITMIEVGSYAGESSDMFASSSKVKTLWCIDPWLPGYDDTDKASNTNFKLVEETFDKIAEKHPTVIRKFKGVLEGFIKEHLEIHPDLVYIDACHTYEGCKNDILNALKLKPKVISGHDYAHWCPGVIKAVDEVLGKPQKTFCDGSWLIKLNP
jgi:hypothetical protein